MVAVAITVYTGGAAMGMFGSGIFAGSAQAYGVAIMGGMLAGAVQTGTLRGAVTGGVSAGIFHNVSSYFSDLTGTRLEHAKTGTVAAARTLSHGAAGGIMSSLQGGDLLHRAMNVC